MPSIRRVQVLVTQSVKRKPGALVGQAAAWAVVGVALAVPTDVQAHADFDQPQARRDALLARVAAVREELKNDYSSTAETPLLTAQATTWTNWPKWSKWSNWTNK
jgi:hypothetical protein